MICTCFPSTQWGAELKQSSRVDTEVKVANLGWKSAKLSKVSKVATHPKPRLFPSGNRLTRTSSIGHLKKIKCSLTINCISSPTLLRGRLGGSDQWSHSWALQWRVFGPQLGLSGGELDEPFGSSRSTSYTVYWYFSLYTELVPASILTCSTKYVRYQVGI